MLYSNLEVTVKTHEAINHFGSVAKLAEKLDIAPQAIYQWGETVPLGRAYQLQVLTEGALQAKDDKEPCLASAA